MSLWLQFSSCCWEASLIGGILMKESPWAVHLELSYDASAFDVYALDITLKHKDKLEFYHLRRVASRHSTY